MSWDVAVRGGTVVTAAGPRRLDVGIADGAIAALEPALEGAAGTEVDATGLTVLPGAVDGHIHLNDPGRSDWEGFATGTRALAAGGATVGVDMPLNASPPTVDGAAFDAKVAAARGTAHVDFALWGGLVPGNVDAMEELAARGVVGFKAFMSNSGIEDFARADDLTLYEGMRRAAALRLPVAVHAESEAITAGLAARARAEGRSGVRDYLASRPVVAETEAIARAIHLAAAAGCALHVVHVSTGAGVALVAAARARGIDVSCETCPHYLVLCEEDAEALPGLAKCAPPLRPAAERDALWNAIAAGDLPMVASDHSPAPPELKEGDDAFAAWGGISGCQSMLALRARPGPPRARPRARDRRRAHRGLPRAPPAARRQGRRRGGQRRRPRARGARRGARAAPRGAPVPPQALALRRAPGAGPRRDHDPARRLVFAGGQVAGEPAGRLVTPSRQETA